MLRTTSGLSRSVVKWMSQVTASVGATLIATMIYSALPRAVQPGMAAPQPELTSGGKFAARAVTPAAYDGLDTMPLPHVAPLPVSVTAAPSAVEVASPVRHAVWDGAAPFLLAPERPAHLAKAPHASARAEAKHLAAPPEPAPRAAALPSAPVETASEAGDEGLMPRVLSKAWTMTASAGGSLMARVVPQIP